MGLSLGDTLTQKTRQKNLEKGLNKSSALHLPLNRCVYYFFCIGQVTFDLFVHNTRAHALTHTLTRTFTDVNAHTHTRCARQLTGRKPACIPHPLSFLSASRKKILDSFIKVSFVFIKHISHNFGTVVLMLKYNQTRLERYFVFVCNKQDVIIWDLKI